MIGRHELLSYDASNLRHARALFNYNDKKAVANAQVKENPLTMLRVTINVSPMSQVVSHVHKAYIHRKNGTLGKEIELTSFKSYLSSITHIHLFTKKSSLALILKVTSGFGIGEGPPGHSQGFTTRFYQIQRDVEAFTRGDKGVHEAETLGRPKKSFSCWQIPFIVMSFE